MSIQRRLLYSMIAVIVAAIAVTAAIVYRQARDEANELFDLQLRQIAASLPIRAFGASGSVPHVGDNVVVRIRNQSGVFVYSSHPEVALPQGVRLGLSTVPTSSGDWRVFATLADENLLEVAQPVRVRAALAAQVAFRTVLPLVILLPLLAALLWWVVGRGLAPLRRVAADVAARRPESLGHLSEAGLPLEIAPLVASLNRLLSDLRIARDAQRAFIADAAHELRTPLTALQLQLQVAEREADPAARRTAIDALHDGLVRASRLVEQLLALARAEPDAPSTLDADDDHIDPAVDLVALARDVVTSHAPLAVERGIDLGLVDEGRSDGALDVRGRGDALRALLGNLVDNALRYTPRGGRVDVSVARVGDAIDLVVADDGPGIAPHERERVFDRFHRGEAARASGETRGSGLGLAIVKRIAERHRAVVALEDGPGGRGLVVRVRFPRAEATSS